MSDIVERLRNGAGCNIGSAPIRQEAADEIERLRECGKRLVAIKRDYDDEIRRLNTELMNAEAEIEGLQAEVNELARLMRKDVDTIKQQAAEIERLRGIEQFSAEASRHERDGLRAEIESLQAALKICAHPMTDWTIATATARAALERKP